MANAKDTQTHRAAGTHTGYTATRARPTCARQQPSHQTL